MIKNRKNIFDRVVELDEIKHELLKDANLHLKYSVNEDTVNSWTRQIIRSQFFVLEAVIYVTKQLAKEIAEGLEKNISVRDLEKIDEKVIDGNGNSKAKFLPADDNVKFTFKCMYDFAGVEWQSSSLTNHKNW